MKIFGRNLTGIITAILVSTSFYGCNQHTNFKPLTTSPVKSVIIGWDEVSVTALNEYPISPGTYAKLIDTLQQYSPRLIIIKHVFTKKSPSTKILAKTLSTYKNVVLAYSFHIKSNQRGNAKDYKRLASAISPQHPPANIITFSQLALPPKAYLSTKTRFGLIDVVLHKDKTYKGMPLIYQDMLGNYHESMGLVILKELLPAFSKLSIGEKSFTLNENSLPIDTQSIPVHRLSRPKHLYPLIKLEDAVKNCDPSYIHDAVVMVGSNIYDQKLKVKMGNLFYKKSGNEIILDLVNSLYSRLIQ